MLTSSTKNSFKDQLEAAEEFKATPAALIWMSKDIIGSLGVLKISHLLARVV